MIGAGVAAVGIVALVVKIKATDHIVSSVAQAVGGAAVDAVGGVATGVVTGVSDAVGIRSPSDTITDANECKAYLDANGWMDASQACSLPAYWSAMRM